MRTRIFLFIVVAGVAIGTWTCSPVYVLRAGVEEAKILSRRTPIAAMVADPSTDEETRRKLGLVLQARTFADQVLGLNAGESYTTYSWIDRDTLALVLSAAKKDRFEAYTWWFPIVGRVPYKGYFSLESAERAADRLERRGYDTYIRPTTAFSTLGWFNDPLLSTLLRYSDVALVSTVIHELTHNTIFLPGRVAFNESFANFVGDVGAIEFFCALEGSEGARCRRARDQWHDNLVFGAFLHELVDELEALYGRDDLDSARKVELRDALLERARTRHADEIEPRYRSPGFRSFGRTPLNNATLIGWRLYYDRLDLFDAVHERLGRDLAASVRAIDDAVRDHRDDPYDALATLAR